MEENNKKIVGLILICHSKKKASSYTDEEGNPISAVEPDIGSKKISQVCNAICDLIGYIGVEFEEDGKPHRYLYTRQTPTVFAGSRWKYLSPRLEFGYQNLVNAIGDAIEKQREVDGAVVVERQEREVIRESTFEEVMTEARSIWTSYLESAETEEEKERKFGYLQLIVSKVFGNQNFKLSQATPAQKDLVSLFIDEAKDLMN